MKPTNDVNKTIREINKLFESIAEPDEKQLKRNQKSYLIQTANKGRVRPPTSIETRLKISEANKNKEKSTKHRESLRLASLAKPKYKCGVCGLECYAGALKRWHNENCKKNKIATPKKPKGGYKKRAPWPKATCTVCGELVAERALNRWHNGNCKKAISANPQ